MRSGGLVMNLSKHKIGQLIKVVDERNSYGITDFYGININKEFMPTVANTEGLDETNYKVIRKNRFVFSGMQTGRDECIRISMYLQDKPIIVSPAYTTFEVVATDIVLPTYFFMLFLSKERDRLGWFYSDGSVRSNLDWDRFCDIELNLPDIPTQQKYVDIYNAMVANQQSYERGLEDLMLVCDGYIENLDDCEYEFIGKFIERNTRRNYDEKFNKTQVKGFNNEGEFIKPMRLFSGDISTFKIINKYDFVYNSRINSTIKKLSVALNEGEDLIVSPAYETFSICDINKLNPFYLCMLLQREIFAKKVLFNSFGSSTLVFGFDDLCEVKIPIPDIDRQRAIADMYRIYKERRHINEQLKAQIKNICPVLIKGSLEE